VGVGEPAGDSDAPARRLIALLEGARPVPLTDQVRVDKNDAYELVAAVRDGAGSSPALVSAAEAVEDAVRNAKPVPLTDQVRLPNERVAELARELRAAGA
jgi:hypothetical protein